MSAAKKKSEGLCSKCVRKDDCEVKVTDSSLVLLRCLDYEPQETNEGEK